MTTIVGGPDVATLLETVYPMLADTSDVQLEDLVGTWVFDQKLDGIRALAAWDGNALTMRNRNGRDLSANYLDLEVAAQSTLVGPVILDGEIVATHGAFQDIAWRDKQNTANATSAMQKVPATFVAFDVLYHPEHGDTRHLPYRQRRLLLQSMNLAGPRWDTSLLSADPKLYDQIRALGGEGVVAKRLDARYNAGRRSDWLKFKSKFSLTCLVCGYEKGKGSRAEMGAVWLGVVDGDSIQQVGRAGSGFTLPEAMEMKRRIDAIAAGEAPPVLPVVEIECLGLTRDGRLRQPVYKGERTDLTRADALASQLIPLPRS